MRTLDLPLSPLVLATLLSAGAPPLKAAQPAVDASGQPAQRFMLVKGARSGIWYLHHGLDAYALVPRDAPDRRGSGSAASAAQR